MTVNLRSQIRSRDFSTGQPFQSLNSLLINDITDVAFSVFLNDYHIAYAPFVIEKSFLSLQYPPTVFLKNHVFQLPSRPQDKFSPLSDERMMDNKQTIVNGVTSFLALQSVE